jgi:hypothetical protein
MYIRARTAPAAFSSHASGARTIRVNNICKKVNDQDREMN